MPHPAIMAIAIILLIITFIVAIYKLPKLKTKPYPKKDKAVLILLIISTCLAIGNEIYKSRKEKKTALQNTNTGVITPPPTKDNWIFWELGGKLFSMNKDKITLDDFLIPRFGQSDISNKFKPFDGVSFEASVKQGKISVSTKVRDTAGNIIAEMSNNEWIVNRPQFAYDRNFNDTSLEVKDNFGEVVFQIEIVSGSIMRMNAKFVKPDGQFIVTLPVRKSRDRLMRMSVLANFDSGLYKWASAQKFFHIKPLFKYPSALHQGEREPIDLSDYEQVLMDNIPNYPPVEHDNPNVYIVFY